MNKRRLEILEHVRQVLGRMKNDTGNLWNKLDDGHAHHALRSIEFVERSVEIAKHRVEYLIEECKRDDVE